MLAFYKEGKKFFDSYDYTKSYDIYTQGDKNGNVYCSFAMAQCLINGIGIKQDVASAQKIFKRIFPILENMAEQGDTTAQIQVGCMYELGGGVEQNEEQAVYWFIEAAKQGNIEGQLILAEMYAEGDLVEENQEQAVYWFAQAANQGDAEAQYFLAARYADGIGVERNYEQAVYWCTQAAENGYEDAQDLFDKLYDEEDDVE